MQCDGRIRKGKNGCKGLGWSTFSSDKPENKAFWTIGTMAGIMTIIIVLSNCKIL